MSNLTSFIQHSWEVLAMANREKKVIPVGNKEGRLLLLADDMILYIENPKDATRKLVELISEFSKIIHLNFLHFYTLKPKDQKLR